MSEVLREENAQTWPLGEDVIAPLWISRCPRCGLFFPGERCDPVTQTKRAALAGA